MGRVSDDDARRRQKRSPRAKGCARARNLINAEEKTDLLCRVEKIIGRRRGNVMEGQEWRGEWHQPRQMDGQ